MNVSQERLNDEQINQIADEMNDLYKAGVLTDKDHGQIEDLIVSHLAVNAELQRCRDALADILECYDLATVVQEVAKKTLEGGSSNV